MPLASHPESRRKTVAGGLRRNRADRRRHRRARQGGHRHLRHTERVQREEEHLAVGVAPEPLGQRAVQLRGRHHDAEGRARPRPSDRHADGLIDVVALLAGLEPESLGGLPLQRPADQCASGEVLVEHPPLGGPGLEHARAVGDEHPVRSGLGPELVGLIEQVGAIAGAKRLLDAGDVGRHLDQGLGEPAERLASARERVTDGGRRGADSPRRGGVGRLVGAMLGDEKGCAEDHDHHRRGAEEDSGAQRHGS